MGKTSDKRNSLFGSTVYYSKLLEPIAHRLSQKYGHEPLIDELLKTLPNRSITVGPMLFCQLLAKDLGTDVSKELLQAIGTLCFHISTHDDLIDEPPKSRSAKAALLYTGNITAIEAVKLLGESANELQFTNILDQVSANHLLQQRCTQELWDTSPKTLTSYEHGIEHDSALVAIGLMGALDSTSKLKLLPQLMEFCKHYGTALQFIDDIAEHEEDLQAGYHSFPSHEGAPFEKSFSALFSHITLAQNALKPTWANLHGVVLSTKKFAQDLEASIRAIRRVHVATAVVTNAQGRVLLLKRSELNKSFNGHWQLPEGKIEQDEHPLLTMKRELKEELNLKLTKSNLITTHETTGRISDQAVAVSRIVYKVVAAGDIRLSTEHNEYRWVDPKVAHALTWYPGTDKILKKYSIWT